MIDVYEGAENICDSIDNKVTEWTNQYLPTEIKNSMYVGKLTLKDIKTSTKRLHIDNCKFDILNIKGGSAQEIESIHMSNCTIQTLHIFQCDIKLTLEKCDVNMLIIEGCKCDRIIIETTSINSISLEKNSKIDNFSITGESVVQKLDSKDAAIEQIKIHSSIINNMHISHDLGDILLSEGAILERFSIGDKSDLFSFLERLNKKRKGLPKGNKNKKILETRHQKQIALAAVNQYEEDHKYQELDMCLVKLRKLDCELKRLESKNILQKLRYIVQEFVLGKMFGWGVKIGNTLITAMLTILGFAVLYFYHLYIKVSVKPELGASMFRALSISVNRFFNVGDSEQILPRFDTIEQILGIILLTIITGVLTRKIIK